MTDRLLIRDARPRLRAQEFSTRLGFVASHVGMKHYLGGES